MLDDSFFAAVNDEIIQVDLWTGKLIRKLPFQHIKPLGIVSFTEMNSRTLPSMQSRLAILKMIIFSLLLMMLEK